MPKSQRKPTRTTLQEKIDADVAFLKNATRGAPIGDPTEEEMAEICKVQRRVRARRIGEQYALAQDATTPNKS
jgi:hypothetical protein